MGPELTVGAVDIRFLCFKITVVVAALGRPSLGDISGSEAYSLLHQVFQKFYNQFCYVVFPFKLARMVSVIYNQLSLLEHLILFIT